jgi:hypothetical protein
MAGPVAGKVAGVLAGVAAGVAAAVALAACGPQGPKVAASEKVVAKAENRGAAWPLMLAHCLRAAACDPVRDFGQGVGTASGSAAEVNWYVESKDVVKEGGADYGASVQLSLYGLRGAGGKGGRPLTIDETVADLHGAAARRTRLTVEYRTPAGGAPEAYHLTVVSAQVVLPAPGVKQAKSQQAMAEATDAYVSAMTWPGGGSAADTGAKIEITGKAGVVYSAYSAGMAAGDITDDKAALARGFEPWVFVALRNIRDEPVAPLLDAIKAGETLGFKVTDPKGDVILADAFYTGGYVSALQEATQALGDPELAKPVLERCARFAAEKPEFWKLADVTPALRVCDPRTPQQREADAR